MKCPNCEYETVADVKFCPQCGTAMPAPEAPPEEPPAAAPPEPAAPAAAPPSIVTMSIPTTPAPPPMTAVAPPVVPAAPPQVAAVTPPAAPGYTAQPAPPEAGAPPVAPPPTPVMAPAATPPKKGGSTWWWWACGCGCLALLAIAIVASVVGLRLAEKAKAEVSKSLEAEGTGGETVETAPAEGGEGGEVAVSEKTSTEWFDVTIPANWTRHADKETGSTKLFLNGPEVDGQALLLGVDVYPGKGGSLTDFSDQFLAEYKDSTWTEDKIGEGVSLCGVEARRVAFTDEDGDNLFYFCAKSGHGIVVTMIAPAGAMGDHEVDFDAVLDEFYLK